jgi:hypothetical protein
MGSGLFLGSCLMLKDVDRPPAEQACQLAFCCALFGDIDVEITDRIGFEFSLGETSSSTCGRRETPCRFRQRCSEDRVRCEIVGCSA